jgi:hypothetical protein
VATYNQDRYHGTTDDTGNHVDQQDRACGLAADSGWFQQRLRKGGHGNEHAEREDRQQ